MAAVMIGVDPHKGPHTAVAIGAAAESLGQMRVRACAAQAQRLLAWRGRGRSGPGQQIVMLGSDIADGLRLKRTERDDLLGALLRAWGKRRQGRCHGTADTGKGLMPQRRTCSALKPLSAAWPG